METLYPFLKFLHILTVIFMAAPLYSLIIVNERVLFSKEMVYSVDRYMETIIGKNAIRCFIFQLTALVTGLWLLARLGWPWNMVLVLKLIGLFSLMILLSIVHFGIQSKIEGHFGRLHGDPIPAEAAQEIKRLAALCLFILIVIVLISLQIFSRFPLFANLIILVLAALFSRRAFSEPLSPIFSSIRQNDEKNRVRVEWW